MKKIIKGRGEFLKPVKLYLNDLEHIRDILRESSLDVKISTGDYVFDSLDELPQLRKEYLTEFKMSIQEPYVSVDFRSDEIWLYIEQDNPVS